jgi:2-hydroxy-3-oxopropionate reductase
MEPDLARGADVAVVGLGAIGLPVCLNLVRSGRRVQAWNRSQGPAAEARRAGAQVVGSLDSLDAPYVLVVLPDMPDIEGVLEAGLGDALRPGDVLVVLSTVAPAAVRALSDRLEASGVRVMDAPVSGGDVGAQQGTLAIMVGADEDVFHRAEPLLRAIGRTVAHLGPVGAGEAAKMANQIVVGATLAALGEALTLARSWGLTDSAVLDVLGSGMAGSRALEIKRSKLEHSDFNPGGSAVSQLKDLDHALATASGLGLELELTTTVRGLYRQLVDLGLGSLDHSAVILTAERAEEGRS